MARAKGMFISEYQKSFTNLGNLDYIFQRTSDGLYTDAELYAMLPQVKTIERRGAVHNFRPDKPWKEQADLFLELSSGKGFVMLVGDYESGILDRQAAIDFFCFMSYIQQQRPTKNIIFYTTIYKLRDNLLAYEGITTEFGEIYWRNFSFWLARYYISKDTATGLTKCLIDPQTKVPDLTISNVEVYDEWDFWQYWADGNQQGAKYGCGSRDTNLDVSNGTVAELDIYLDLEVIVPLPDPPVVPDPPENCTEAVTLAVAEVSLRYVTQIEEMQKQISDLTEAKALAFNAGYLAGNNDALQNLIKPYLL